MSKQPGQAIYDGRTVSFPSDGTPEPGQAVMLSGGQLTPTTATTDNLIGIVTDKAPEAADQDAGDNIPVHVTGVVVASAEGTVAAGEDIGPSAVAGELAATGDGVDAYSDEGGAFKQSDEVVTPVTLPAGYAAVNLG